MSTLRKSLNKIFSPIVPLNPGLYHYMSPPDDPRNYRLHLRLEVDGSGVLIINASTILHLNQSAAEYAYYLIQNLPNDIVARKIASRYTVSKEQAALDYQQLIDQIQILVNTPDLDPETFLDFDRKPPLSGNISAPYRLDCAITYRLPGEASAQVAPIERASRELSSDEWKLVFDKAWAVGIPHIFFTGGEPTLRADLPELISHCENNNQITGLVTDGLKISESDYLATLLQAGLDHMMIVYDPKVERIQKSIENVLLADLFFAVHLTLTNENLGQIIGWIDYMTAMGVRAMSISGNDPAQKPQIETIRNYIAAKNVELIWNLPVPYSALNPVAFELNHSVEIPPGAVTATLYVEPDGDILPAQGIDERLGNILTDSWNVIWR